MQKGPELPPALSFGSARRPASLDGGPQTFSSETLEVRQRVDRLGALPQLEMHLRLIHLT